jgi:hypothetical protein
MLLAAKEQEMISILKKFTASGQQEAMGMGGEAADNQRGAMCGPHPPSFH